MKGTKIRWCDHSWNPVVGCTKISEGCDNCYAEAVTVRFGARTFPQGFEPTFKPQKLAEPARWARTAGPGRIFVNSMSDLHHAAFTDDQRDAVYLTMIDSPHDYLVLTKRPQAMRRYFTEHFLPRLELDVVPDNIWLGTSIELDKWCRSRVRALAAIPAFVRFLSLEPLLGPLPSLDLADIDWVIVGGESGPGFRPMELDWARAIRDRCATAGVAFFFKQSAAYRTEQGIWLDDRRHEEYPLAHPAERVGPPAIGRWP